MGLSGNDMVVHVKQCAHALQTPWNH
jgi:hypothetical protein